MKRKRLHKQNRKLKRLAIFNLLASMAFFAMSHNNQVLASAFWPVTPPVGAQGYSNDTDWESGYLPAFLHVPDVGVQSVQFGDIRIGLESRYRNVSSVALANQTLAVGFSGELNTPFVPFATLTGHDFRGMVDNGYYLDSNHWFGTFHEAHQIALEIGQGTATTGVVSATPAGFGVFVGPFATAAELAQAQGFLPGFTPVPASRYRVSLMNGGHRVLTADMPLQFFAPDELMALGGRSYRGVIEIGRHTGAGITPVNVIDIEYYLKSVVPSEMPAGWHIEALKAQTIAARSFTMARRGSHAHLGYELCDTIFSQVYSGVDMEHPNSTAAVLGTVGLLAWHGDQVILATYFSSSGGATENSEDVWIEAVPYLRSIIDSHETGAMEWERRFTMSQLTQLASANSLNIGTVTAVSLYHADNGRVRRLTLHGHTDYSIEREAIRTFFNSSADGSLQSRNFFMRNAQATGTVHVAPSVLAAAAPIQSLAISDASVTNWFDNEFSGAQNTEQVQVLTYIYSVDAHGNPVRTEQLLSISGWNPNLPPAGEVGSVPMPVFAPSLPTPDPAAPPMTPTAPDNPNFSPEGEYLWVSRSTGYVIELDGRGWGHGVGMSQFGAHSMAQQGFNHLQILQHYYVGVAIR